MVIDSLQTGQKFKKTEIGEIPVDWETCLLGECSLYLGRGKGPDYIESESRIKAINQKCVRNGRVDQYLSRNHNGKTIIKEDIILKDGDICVNSTGTGTIGRAGLWKQQDDINYFVDSHVTLIRLNPESMNSKFVSEVLNLPNFQKVLADECFSGSTNQIELNKQAFHSFKIPSPSLNEQNKIANILKSVDDAIEKSDQVIEKTKELKKGLMQQLLTRGIGHSAKGGSASGGRKFKKTELGEIPEEWEVVNIGRICEVIGGSTPSTKNKNYWDGSISWAVPTDITKLTGNVISETERSITENGLSACAARLLPEGSILLTSRATLGECAINKVPMATNQGFASLVCGDKVYNWFLFYQIKGLQNQFNKFASGSTFKEISKKAIRSIQIALPSFDEQIKIANSLLEIDEQIKLEEDNKKFLETIKIGLMQVLLTGKRRVR